MTNVLRRIGNVVAGLVLGIAVVLLVATQVMGYRVATVATDSMRPTLSPGDLIVTRPVPITEIEHGDIVLFETGVTTRITVAHRVDGVVTVNLNITDSKTGDKHTETTKILHTKGDANPLADAGVVDQAAYRGLLWLTVPGAGPILASPVPFILIAAGLGLAWFALELVGWGRRSRSGPSDEDGDSG